MVHNTEAYEYMLKIRPLVETVAWSGFFLVLIHVIMRWYESSKASGNQDPSKKSSKSIMTVLMDLLLAGVRPTAEQRAALAATKKQPNVTTNKPSTGRLQQFGSLAISFVGLQASFLTWGWVQERLMTTEYGGKDRFPSSNMLVLSNRIFAIVFSSIVISFSRNSYGTRAPFLAFAYPSIANTLSSFASYESLKFMSFPMSTVVKTLKIVPTMLTATIIHRKIYSKEEYAAALMITTGAALFAIEFGMGGLENLMQESHQVQWFAILPGITLMGVYLAVDAFTSNLQSFLFQEYLLTPYECMFGINLFSLFLGMFNLAQSNELAESINFLIIYPSAFIDLTLLALSSASGQMFIYYTIEKHGPVTFTIIQLIRQLLAILLSSWTFGHSVNVNAWIGVVLTFTGILAMNLASKRAAKKPEAVANKQQAKKVE